MNVVARPVSTVKVAMAQMLVEGGRPAENLERAGRMIREAAASGARVVVLPECLDLGWTDPSALDMARPIPGPHFQALAEVARECAIHVAAGLVERFQDRIYNAAVLIGPAGELLLLHRKINELDIAHHMYAIGDRLGVAETEFGTVGLDICADNFPDSLAIGHVLARMGAQIILSPSAWAFEVNHDPEVEPYSRLWLDAYSRLSPLYDLPIVGVSSVGWVSGGPWEGRKLNGGSLAMGGSGEVLALGPYGSDAEALVLVDVPLRQPSARGTLIADQLRERGYTGP